MVKHKWSFIRVSGSRSHLVTHEARQPAIKLKSGNSWMMVRQLPLACTPHHHITTSPHHHINITASDGALCMCIRIVHVNDETIQQLRHDLSHYCEWEGKGLDMGDVGKPWDKDLTFMSIESEHTCKHTHHVHVATWTFVHNYVHSVCAYMYVLTRNMHRLECLHSDSSCFEWFKTHLVSQGRADGNVTQEAWHRMAQGDSNVAWEMTSVMGIHAVCANIHTYTL